MKIDFACPSLSIKNGNLQWQQGGRLQIALRRCWPYPPIFKSSKKAWVAAPFATRESVAYLKGRGVQLILFVNVMDTGPLFTDPSSFADYKSSLLWQEIRRASKHIQGTEDPDVHIEVISVPTRNFPLDSFDKHRALIHLGHRLEKKPQKYCGINTIFK